MNQTICLNMIVKDETAVIERCLNSVLPLIHYWVIVDTGSTDGTQALIKKVMQKMPGELHERPWVNFEHNRNEALDFAKGKGDYFLILDADELLMYDPQFKFPRLFRDLYLSNVHLLNDVTYFRPILAAARLNWRWQGVLHEQLTCPEARHVEVIREPKMVTVPDGKRSRDPEKFYKDIKILEAALAKDPTDSRSAFFYAQSLVGAKLYHLGIAAYERRIALGGWDEETYQAYFSIALIQLGIKEPLEVFIPSFMRAYRFRPSRAEPLYWIADHLIGKGRFAEAYPYVQEALTIPFPPDNLLVDTRIYDHALLWQKVVCTIELGLFEESYHASKELLTRKLSAENRRVFQKKIAEVHPSLVAIITGFNEGICV